MTHNLENLEGWNCGCSLAVNVCVASHESREFLLKDQIQRPAISIPSHIAEGSERASEDDFARFLTYGEGSCDHREIYRELTVRPFPDTDLMIGEIREISRMISGLIGHLKSPVPPPLES